MKSLIITLLYFASYKLSVSVAEYLSIPNAADEAFKYTVFAFMGSIAARV